MLRKLLTVAIFSLAASVAIGAAMYDNTAVHWFSCNSGICTRPVVSVGDNAATALKCAGDAGLCVTGNLTAVQFGQLESFGQFKLVHTLLVASIAACIFLTAR